MNNFKLALLAVIAVGVVGCGSGGGGGSSADGSDGNSKGVVFKKLVSGEVYTDSATSLGYPWGKPITIVADVDGDDNLDYISFPSNFTLPTSVPFAVYLSDGNGKFSYRSDFIQNEQPHEFVRDVVTADFDSDGDNDYVLLDTGWELVGVDWQGGHLAYLEQTNNGLIYHKQIEFTGHDKRSFNHIGSSGDINTDGNLDFVVATFNMNDINFGLYLGNGDGTFTLDLDMVKSLPMGGSGAGFVKIGDRTKIVVGDYRYGSVNDTKYDIQVFGMQNGSLVLEQELIRPFADSYGRNYGATSIENHDFNGDQLEDLMVIWETTAEGGIDDGISPELDEHGLGIRYGAVGLGNAIFAQYEQQFDGTFKLVDVMSGTGQNMAVDLRFLDIDNDGDLDFYNTNYGSKPQKFHENVFLNDGSGNFHHAQKFDTASIVENDWLKVLAEFADADKDGHLDVIAFKAAFNADASRSIGGSVSTYLTDYFEPLQGNDATVSIFP